jgi:hypothetical protein
MWQPGALSIRLRPIPRIKHLSRAGGADDEEDSMVQDIPKCDEIGNDR